MVNDNQVSHFRLPLPYCDDSRRMEAYRRSTMPIKAGLVVVMPRRERGAGRLFSCSMTKIMTAYRTVSSIMWVSARQPRSVKTLNSPQMSNWSRHFEKHGVLGTFKSEIAVDPGRFWERCNPEQLYFAVHMHEWAWGSPGQRDRWGS